MRNEIVVFAAGAVNAKVAVFVTADAMADGFGPEACDHA
jgi:hypothetical protein